MGCLEGVCVAFAIGLFAMCFAIFGSGTFEVGYQGYGLHATQRIFLGATLKMQHFHVLRVVQGSRLFFPRNFYVDHTCIDCDTCRWMAPQTFGRTARSGPGQSVVHQQLWPKQIDLLAFGVPVWSMFCEDSKRLPCSLSLF